MENRRVPAFFRKLLPGGGASRAQAASILMNFCENVAR